MRLENKTKQKIELNSKLNKQINKYVYYIFSLTTVVFVFCFHDYLEFWQKAALKISTRKRYMKIINDVWVRDSPDILTVYSVIVNG